MISQCHLSHVKRWWEKWARSHFSGTHPTFVNSFSAKLKVGCPTHCSCVRNWDGVALHWSCSNYPWINNFYYVWVPPNDSRIINYSFSHFITILTLEDWNPDSFGGFLTKVKQVLKHITKVQYFYDYFPT